MSRYFPNVYRGAQVPSVIFIYTIARKWGLLGFAAALLLLGMGGQARAQDEGQSLGPANIKLGFNRSLVSGATYTLTDSSGEAISNSDSMTGNDVYAEFILFSRFGVEFNVGLLEMEREYTLTDSSGTLVANVTETARPTTVTFNLYFQDQSTTGFKFLFGLGAGVIDVEHRFSGGTLGSEFSKESVTISLMKFGMDWLTDKAGFRAQIVTMEGDREDSDEVPTYQQTIDYTATVATIGVFMFF